MLQKGSVLGGRYELVDRLGEGGMGSVWVARNTAIGGAEVAVKVLHPNLADDKSSVSRFRNEAQIAARIGHRNIVRVFDFGESDDEAPFMVMERLLGESLAERLEREGALDPREAVELVCVVLEALAAAHEKDVLHRDLKPENIFLAREGSLVVPKILDFGVSKILGDDARRTRMTRTGAIIGTPAYMSPEQVMGTPVDLRSDVWAMGVILYELVTGRLPFDAPNYNAVLVRIATSEHDPITVHVPSIDAGLASIVDRAMARKPGGRFASAVKMRETLEAWLRGEVVAQPASPRRVATDPNRFTPMAFEQSDTLPGGTPSLMPPPSNRRLITAGVVAMCALSAVMIAWNPFKRPAPEATTMLHRSAVEAEATLRIENLPAGAHVHVDGAPVMLPTKVTASASHRVRVSAAGYHDWMQVVQEPRGDVTLSYAGERAPEAPRAVVDASVAAPARLLARELPAKAASARARPSTQGAAAAHTRTAGAPNGLIGTESPF
ncbi:MAG: serine/threonine-protein kinase [Polyangiales bacterium]